MKSIIYLLIALLFFKNSLAQTYRPIDSLSAEGKALKLKEYNDRGKEFEKSIDKQYSGGERKFIKKKFEDLHKEFGEDIKDGQYVFDKSFDAKVNEIVKALRAGNRNIPDGLSFYISKSNAANAFSMGHKNFIINKSFDAKVNEIVKALRAGNRNIPDGLSFYISKSNAANAFSMGDKNFIINMGSFYYFENEAQMAAVIAHEAAHLLLQHSLKTIRQKYAIQKNSAKKELRAIKSKGEKKGENALNFLKQMLEEESKRSRQADYAADSLGYLLFKKTKYPHDEFVNALQLLAEYDTLQPKGLNIDTYKKVFHLPNQPFKDEWLQRENFSAYDYTKYQA